VKVLPFRGTDAELLIRLQADPEAAAAALHDRFAREVNALVWRLLGADQEHHDIVQDIFIKLLTSCKSVREADKLGGWVQRVTVNTVYSELRKRGVRRLFLAEQQVAPSRAFDQTAHVESRDLLARVYGELGRMGAAERVAFSLRYIEQKPLSEVAELCDCSLATIKRRLRKATIRFAAMCDRFPELANRFNPAFAEDSDA
jgi:RNA polymerase sigma-70 factor (ECF subfamily)